MDSNNNHCALWEATHKPLASLVAALITTIFAASLSVGSVGLFVIVFFGFWFAMCIS